MSMGKPESPVQNAARQLSKLSLGKEGPIFVQDAKDDKLDRLNSKAFESGCEFSYFFFAAHGNDLISWL